MVLLEFYCEPCKCQFEQITHDQDPDRGKCPKCQGKKTRKLISRFRIGGQGDLRESTLHGCHDYSGVDHGHTHGPGCGHSSGGGSESPGGESQGGD